MFECTITNGWGGDEIFYFCPLGARVARRRDGVDSPPRDEGERSV